MGSEEGGNAPHARLSRNSSGLSLPTREGRQERKGRKAQVQPALTCCPSPGAARRAEYFNPKGRLCLRAEVPAGCSQAGAGLRPPGIRAARPPAHPPAAAELGSPAPLCFSSAALSGAARHGTAGCWAHGGRSGCPCQAQLRLGADRGCGRRRKRREGRRREGGKKAKEVGMLLWAGDITAPAASSVRGRAKEAPGLFVPPEDPAAATEKGSREPAAGPAPLPPASPPP